MPVSAKTIQLLRKCMDCGLEAHSKDELKKFTKNAESSYGRKNLCKQCENKRGKEKREKDDRYYLRLVFSSMKKKCYNLNDIAYPDYGGRGITICEEWLQDPVAFVDWALSNKEWKRELSIDRIDNDGQYNPDNCRWATRKGQQRNMRSNVTDFEKGTRICWQCKEEQPLEDFHRDTGKPEGRRYICKTCTKENDRARYRRKT